MPFVWMTFLLGAGFAAGWAVAARQGRAEEKMRARFLSFVAHEINTPVTSLYMTVMNLINGLFGTVPEEQKPWLNLLREQTWRLSLLIGDLRDLIHSEFHRDLSLAPERTSVAELLAQALDGMRDSMTRSGASVELRVEPDLPAASADPDRLARCLSSVLTHARKFRTRGPIVVDARRARESVHVRVEYQGMPIPRERLEHALELYFPVLSGESQVLAGVGLGLGLPRLLTEAQGGRMSLDADGEGRIVISLELPRHREEV